MPPGCMGRRTSDESGGLPITVPPPICREIVYFLTIKLYNIDITYRCNERHSVDLPDTASGKARDMVDLSLSICLVHCPRLYHNTYKINEEESRKRKKGETCLVKDSLPRARFARRDAVGPSFVVKPHAETAVEPHLLVWTWAVWS